MKGGEKLKQRKNKTVIQRYRLEHAEIHRMGDRMIDRQIDRQIDIQIDRQIDRYVGRQGNIKRWIYRQKDISVFNFTFLFKNELY